jgi:hypothetical protein
VRLLSSRAEIGPKPTEQKVEYMPGRLTNYVKFYGTHTDIYGASSQIAQLHDHLQDYDGPVMQEFWSLGPNFCWASLDTFSTEDWDSTNKLMQETSKSYPNVVLEWSRSKDDIFYSSIFKNGCNLYHYRKSSNCKGKKLAGKHYYPKALRLIKLAKATREQSAKCVEM